MTGRIEFRPKPEKIVETILYLAHKGLQLDQYRVVKLLYLADREHLNRYGRPITFDHMVAMENGPVASVAYDILKGNHIEGIDPQTLPFNLERIDPYVFVEKPKRDVNKKLFSKSDLRVLDEIAEKYGRASFKELFDMTHEHYAYRHAWDERPEGMKSVDMFFEDMIEESEKKESMVDDLEVISSRM